MGIHYGLQRHKKPGRHTIWPLRLEDKRPGRHTIWPLILEEKRPGRLWYSFTGNS